MRSSQWTVLGFFLILMGSWFVYQDMYGLGIFCDIEDDSPVTRADMIACANAEMFDPFIWLLFPLGFVFFICSWIEERAEKKKKK